MKNTLLLTVLFLYIMDWINSKWRVAAALICIGLLATVGCKEDEPSETPF